MPPKPSNPKNSPNPSLPSLCKLSNKFSNIDRSNDRANTDRNDDTGTLGLPDPSKYDPEHGIAGHFKNANNTTEPTNMHLVVLNLFQPTSEFDPMITFMNQLNLATYVFFPEQTKLNIRNTVQTLLEKNTTCPAFENDTTENNIILNDTEFKLELGPKCRPVSVTTVIDSEADLRLPENSSLKIHLNPEYNFKNFSETTTYRWLQKIAILRKGVASTYQTEIYPGTGFQLSMKDLVEMKPKAPQMDINMVTRFSMNFKSTFISKLHFLLVSYGLENSLDILGTYPMYKVEQNFFLTLQDKRLCMEIFDQIRSVKLQVSHNEHACKHMHMHMHTYLSCVDECVMLPQVELYDTQKPETENRERNKSLHVTLVSLDHKFIEMKMHTSFDIMEPVLVFDHVSNDSSKIRDDDITNAIHALIDTMKNQIHTPMIFKSVLNTLVILNDNPSKDNVPMHNVSIDKLKKAELLESYEDLRWSYVKILRNESGKDSSFKDNYNTLIMVVLYLSVLWLYKLSSYIFNVYNGNGGDGGYGGTPPNALTEPANNEAKMSFFDMFIKSVNCTIKSKGSIKEKLNELQRRRKPYTPYEHHEPYTPFEKDIIQSVDDFKKFLKSPNTKQIIEDKVGINIDGIVHDNSEFHYKKVYEELENDGLKQGMYGDINIQVDKLIQKFVTYINKIQFPNKEALKEKIDSFVSNSTNDEVYGPIGTWLVGKVTDMEGLFNGYETFNEPLAHWDVSNVTSMKGMFSGCKNFNQPIGSWNVENVENFQQMFYNCESFNKELNGWDLTTTNQRPINVAFMFVGCENFEQFWSLKDWFKSDVNEPVDEDLFFSGKFDVSGLTKLFNTFKASAQKSP